MGESSIFGIGSSQKSLPTSDPIAMAKQSKLIKEQWDDYKKRFRPVEDQLINDVSGTKYHTKYNQEGLDNAQGLVNTAYGSAKEMQARDQQRIGVSYTPQQQQAMDSAVNIYQSKTLDNTTNNARQADIDRKNAVISGGLSGVA
jgi:hypothetical protein